MSQATAEPGNRLSEVLSRINTLSRQSQAEPSHEVSREDSVPRLTESYDGNLPLQFIKAGSASLPILEDAVNAAIPEKQAPELSTAEQATSQSEGTAPVKLTAEQQELMLLEMEPVIRDAVKRAILRELVVIEKALKTTLERDVMDALRKRLESGQL
ncbi:MAG: hypothetical protein CVU15_11225 [Betaproteobacteria bacterium HGW-Betaproteobacteria-1]|jgi:hypothetical protein|nr:MAG: hypothetical protein CVU15_11225 [Betaproteobacteria bacterium HGW-Betaproteobacteria-1]